MPREDVFSYMGNCDDGHITAISFIDYIGEVVANFIRDNNIRFRHKYCAINKV